jgi:hypothetical protein
VVKRQRLWMIGDEFLPRGIIEIGPDEARKR